MDLVDDRPRSVVAYELARRLIYHTSAVDLTVSPVRCAMTRLDALLEEGRLAPSEHHGLSVLLQSVEGCDIDQCHAKDELVMQLTRQMAAHPERFSDAKLEQLASLV